MLRMMRRNAKSWVVKFVFAVIIVVFSFWGVGSMKARKMTVAATVDGKIIERRELDKAFRNLWQKYQQQSRGRFNPTEAQIKQIKREALDNLINRRLLLEQAAALGLDVTRDELQQKIASLPAFQRDGRFSQRLYQQALKYYRETPAQFEEGLRNDLLINKLRLIISDGAKALPDEIEILLRQQREEIALDILRIDPEKYQAQMKFAEEDLKKYFSANREKFRIPEQRKAVIVVVEAKSLLDGIKIDKEQVEQYYKDNLDKYKVPERVKASHILIKVAPDATAEEVEKAKARIAEIEKEIQAGGDFAALAKKYSQGPSGPQGGKLGWFGRGSMVKAFEEAAFALQDGQVSKPVRTQFGFHLIKVEKHEAAHTKKLAEVGKEIEKQLRQQRLPELLEKKFAEIKKELGDVPVAEFIRKAEQHKWRVVSSDYFKEKDGQVPGIGRDRTLAAKIFSTEPGKTSELINPSRNSYFFIVSEKKESYLPELDEVRAEVERAYRLELARKKVEKISAEVAAKLKKGEKLEAVAKELKIDLVDTGYFTRGRGVVPKLGPAPKLSLQFFALKPGEVSPALKYRDSMVFARLRERRFDLGAERAKLEKRLQQQLLQYKRSHLMREFVGGLRRDAEIKVMAGVLD
ncbi:MAG: hypothetical protein GXO34_05370 [Deltaproteobacteria bacterium]|nr:hypothetical protein [Deltaproteobacteria bacterium]